MAHPKDEMLFRESSTFGELPHELIEAALSGASEKTMAVLLVLARRPEEWLTVEEIADCMPKLTGRAPGNSWSLGGVLGAFAGKTKRLGIGRTLIGVRYDSRVGRYRYKMDEHVAAAVAKVHTSAIQR